MNLKIEIQKNIFLKTTITNHSRFKDPNIYFLPDFHLFFFFFFSHQIFNIPMDHVSYSWYMAQFFNSH